MNNKRSTLAAALMLSLGGLLWWKLALTTRGPQPGAPPVVSESANRWAPLFDAKLPRSARLSSAISVDKSFPLASLAEWAASQSSGEGGQEMETDFLIYNEILDQSRRRDLHPSTLGRFLITAVHSSTLEPTFRDYSVQHLAQWLSLYQSGQPSEADPALRSEGLKALTSIVTDPTVRDLSLPGTALMSLADIEANHAADLTTHWPALDRTIAEMIESADTPSTLRLAALQAAGRARRTAHLPGVRRLVAAPTGSQTLLMAAVATLGKLGTTEDIPNLTAFVDSDSPASAAAASAVKLLSTKHP
jgi:hypothetical protein